MKTTLYYLETKQGKEKEIIDKLKWFGLNTECIEEEFDKRRLHGGEYIMWSSQSEYPAWVFRGQQKVVESCGIKVSY